MSKPKGDSARDLIKPEGDEDPDGRDVQDARDPRTQSPSTGKEEDERACGEDHHAVKPDQKGGACPRGASPPGQHQGPAHDAPEDVGVRVEAVDGDPAQEAVAPAVSIQMVYESAEAENRSSKGLRLVVRLRGEGATPRQSAGPRETSSMCG